MKILHAYNLHRHGGGSDNASLETVALLNKKGVDTAVFVKDSKQLPGNLSGKIKAFYSGLYAIDAIREFREILDQYQPHILHAHELYPLISPWILVEAKKRGIKVVVTCYDYRFTCPIATHFSRDKICTECLDMGNHRAIVNNCRDNIIESTAYAARASLAKHQQLFTNNVDSYIVLNDFSRQWLTSRCHIDDAKIKSIGCIINPADSPVIPSQGEYIAYAGRFAKEKGINVLVEATAGLNYPVKLAGYEEQLSSFNQDNIQVIRTRSKEELNNFYRKAKMLVVPSIWFETFGIVAAEAMAHGVPVIASNIGALAYTVKNGVSGLVFEPGNSLDLRDKIKQLLDDNNLTNHLGAGAYQQVIHEYHEDVIFEKLLSVYQNLLSQ